MLIDRPNGGPAFPRPASKGTNYVTGDPEDNVDPQDGMSLRDWFAGQAILGTVKEVALCASVDDQDMLLRHIPKAAYQIADAMLAEREKT